MNKLYIEYTNGIEASIYLRDDANIGIYDGCSEIIIDPYYGLISQL